MNLGTWVGNQRYNKEDLRPDQIRRLDSLDFIWDPRAEQWEEGFAALQKFYQREGHCRVPARSQEFGLNLGTWVNNQRSNKDLTSDQIRRLDSLGFSWDPLAEQWEQGFAALQKFHQREGHCLVPQRHQEIGLNLGSWVGTQRARKEGLTPNQIRRLDNLGFIWDPRAEQWEEGFAALQKFYQREGHSRVPKGHQEFGLNLGTWVNSQRNKNEGLTTDQIRRLDSLGFSWDPHSEQWEEGFAALQKFHQREGHCRVLKRHQEFGLNLGSWVTTQRSKKDRLSPDRLKRLNALGFVWKT